MATLMHTTALLLLALLSIRVLRNLHFLWSVQHPNNPEQSQPRVSILVPARNEAVSITRCLESLARQDYPDYEILVLDDQSTDTTLAQIKQVVGQYPMVNVLHGDHAPPPGWNGKSYACQRLAEQASGEWLLFTDADTYHTPQSISQGIQQAIVLDVDLLSAMPRQLTLTWSEKLMVSFIMDFLPLLGIDLQRMWHGHGSHAIANGQYMLVRKTAYQALGGHATISNALVDDFALANHFLQNNRRIALVNGTSMLACRMYHNASAVWQGFSKNIVLSLQTASQWPWWSVLLFAWGFVALFVGPYARLLQSNHWLALVEICWLSILRLVVCQQYRRPVVEILLTPVAAIGVMLMSLNALALKYRRQNITWKERPYTLNQ